jgi:hypothetical protein
MKQRSARS